MKFKYVINVQNKISIIVLRIFILIRNEQKFSDFNELSLHKSIKLYFRYFKYNSKLFFKRF